MIFLKNSSIQFISLIGYAKNDFRTIINKKDIQVAWIS